MKRIVVMGAGIAGMSAAYELRNKLGNKAEISVYGDGPRFSFTPSNPWLAVGWRDAEQITLDAGEHLVKKNIRFVPERITEIDPVAKTVRGIAVSWININTAALLKEHFSDMMKPAQKQKATA